MPLQNLIGLGGVMDQYAGLPPRQDPADALGRQALGLAEETGNAGLGEEFLASQWRNGGPDIDPSTLAMLRLLQKQQRAPLTALEGELGGLDARAPTERFGDTLLRLGKTGELEAVGQDFTTDPMFRSLTPASMSRRSFAGLQPAPKIGGFIAGKPKALPQMTPEQRAEIVAKLQAQRSERDTKRGALTEDVAEARRLFGQGVRGQGLSAPIAKRQAKEESQEVQRRQGALDFFRNKRFEVEREIATWRRNQVAALEKPDSILTPAEKAQRLTGIDREAQQTRNELLKSLLRSLSPRERQHLNAVLGATQGDGGVSDESDSDSPLGTLDIREWGPAGGFPPLFSDPDALRRAMGQDRQGGRYPNTDPLGMLLNALGA